jgi:hypothetical protein
MGMLQNQSIDRSTVSKTGQTDRTTVSDLRWQTIERRMRELEPVLRRQGAITAKTGRKSPAWSLRYKDYSTGKRVQKTLYLGTDPGLVQRAQRLLEHFRRVERWDREIELAGRKMKRIVAVLRRPRRSDRRRAGPRGAVRH